MHTQLFLIVKLTDELIKAYESKEECVKSLAENTMENMVNNNENFDWYNVEEALPCDDTLKKSLYDEVNEHISYVSIWIGEVRTCLATHSDEALAESGDWRFQFNCHRIGSYAGSDISVYLIDEYGSYDGIITVSSLDYQLGGEGETWVATVDAHS
jgi:hypothetical protein